MRVTVKGKNTEVTDALQRYAEKKVEHLSKYFNAVREAIVTQTIEKNRQIVEINLDCDGLLLRAKESSENMYASIDLAVDKLEQQIRRFKGKLIERAHPAMPPKELLAVTTGGPEEEAEAPILVRTKSFPLKPMTSEEATMQMELLNHDFFVFLNADSESVNVIYKRKDGNYGLIEPEG